MDIIENINKNINIDTLKIMIFIYNALEKGWTVKKNKHKSYVFNKKHNNKKEVFNNKYLTSFIEGNSDIKSIINEISNEIE